LPLKLTAIYERFLIFKSPTHCGTMIEADVSLFLSELTEDEYHRAALQPLLKGKSMQSGEIDGGKEKATHA